MTEQWSVDQYRAYLHGTYAQHLLQRAETDLPPPSLTHKAFQAAIVRLAKAHHWKPHFTVNSRKSPSGWFDLVLARPGDPLVIAELKVGKDPLSPDQEDWWRILQAVPGIEVYVWHGPGDFPGIEARLTQPRRDTRC